jgi:CheY-like chemotaxis protein
MKELRNEMEKINDEKRLSKVLIVEDSTLFRQLLNKALQDRFSKIEIEEAKNGKEALYKTESFRPDLIFMDIELPGENGLVLSRKIKARYPNIIIIILTHYDLLEFREASLECADFFFSKDLSTAETLLNLAQSVL